MNLYSALSCSRLHIESAQIWPVCNNWITQFYLAPTHEPLTALLVIAEKSGLTQQRHVVRCLGNVAGDVEQEDAEAE